MRKLNGHDVFMALNVIREVGLKDKIKELMKNNGQIDTEEAGMDLVFDVLGALGSPRAEVAVFGFLSGPMEMAPEDMQKMDALELMENIRKVFTEVNDKEAWGAFFKSLLGVLGLS